MKLFCSVSQLHVVPIIGWVPVIGSVTLVMVRCQQIRAAIRMILDEARKAKALRDRKASGGDRWKIMQLPTHSTGYVCIHYIVGL